MNIMHFPISLHTVNKFNNNTSVNV